MKKPIIHTCIAFFAFVISVNAQTTINDYENCIEISPTTYNSDETLCPPNSLSEYDQSALAYITNNCDQVINVLYDFTGSCVDLNGNPSNCGYYDTKWPQTKILQPGEKRKIFLCGTSKKVSGEFVIVKVVGPQKKLSKNDSDSENSGNNGDEDDNVDENEDNSNDENEENNGNENNDNDSQSDNQYALIQARMEASRLVGLAEEYERRDNPEEALKLYKKANALYPTNETQQKVQWLTAQVGIRATTKEIAGAIVENWEEKERQRTQELLEEKAREKKAKKEHFRKRKESYAVLEEYASKSIALLTGKTLDTGGFLILPNPKKHSNHLYSLKRLIDNQRKLPTGDRADSIYVFLYEPNLKLVGKNQAQSISKIKNLNILYTDVKAFSTGLLLKHASDAPDAAMVKAMDPSFMDFQNTLVVATTNKNRAYQLQESLVRVESPYMKSEKRYGNMFSERSWIKANINANSVENALADLSSGNYALEVNPGQYAYFWDNKYILFTTNGMGSFGSTKGASSKLAYEGWIRGDYIKNKVRWISFVEIEEVFLPDYQRVASNRFGTKGTGWTDLFPMYFHSPSYFAHSEWLKPENVVSKDGRVYSFGWGKNWLYAEALEIGTFDVNWNWNYRSKNEAPKIYLRPSHLMMFVPGVSFDIEKIGVIKSRLRVPPYLNTNKTGFLDPLTYQKFFCHTNSQGKKNWEDCYVFNQERRNDVYALYSEKKFKFVAYRKSNLKFHWSIINLEEKPSWATLKKQYGGVWKKIQHDARVDLRKRFERELSDRSLHQDDLSILQSLEFVAGQGKNALNISSQAANSKEKFEKLYDWIAQGELHNRIIAGEHLQISALKRKALPKNETKKGNSKGRLFRAIKEENTAQVAALLASGADPNKLVNYFNNGVKVSLLQLAAIKGNEKMVKALLDAGARVEYGSTATTWNTLDFAINYGKSPEIIRMLISAGATKNTLLNFINGGYNYWGNCLHLAILTGEAEVVKILLEEGMDPNEKGSTGLTDVSCLELAQKLKTSSEKEAILDLLRQYGGE